MTFLDVIALLVLGLLAVVGIGVVVWLAMLPGKIARKRQHPQADAINMTGYFGVLFAPLWVGALIWSYTRPGTYQVAFAIAAMNERLSRLEQGPTSPPHATKED